MTSTASTRPATMPAATFAGPPSGTYASDELRIMLHRNGDTYRGTAQLDEGRFELRGQYDRMHGLSGTFNSAGETFDWSAEATADGLIFRTAGDEYVLARETSPAQNPLARKPRLRDRGVQGDAPAEEAPEPPSDALTFTRLSVTDRGTNNIEAVSLLIPGGWKIEGGVRWLPDDSILANLLMTVSDPNTGAAVEFLPMQNFTWPENPAASIEPGTHYMGMTVAAPTEDIPEFIEGFYGDGPLRRLAARRPVNVEPLPRVAQEVAQSNGARATARAARVRYEYEIDGKAWQEDVYVSLLYLPWQTGTMWSVSTAYSFRAPRGELDRLTPMMTTIASSARLSLDWFAQYMHLQSLFHERMVQGVRDAGAISQGMSGISDEIRQRFTDSYRQHCESQERISQSWSETIRGVGTYQNPFEDRPIQLPSGYRDAWVNAAGEYILTGGSSFDPNVGDAREWRRMEAAK